MSLTVHTELGGDAAVVAVAGELDMATAPEVWEKVDGLLSAGRHRLVFDLSELSFCDSTGLSVFVRARNRSAASGGEVFLAAPQRAVRRVLEVSGLVAVLPMLPTVEEAVSSALRP